MGRIVKSHFEVADLINTCIVLDDSNTDVAYYLVSTINHSIDNDN